MHGGAGGLLPVARVAGAGCRRRRRGKELGRRRRLVRKQIGRGMQSRACRRRAGRADAVEAAGRATTGACEEPTRQAERFDALELGAGGRPCTARSSPGRRTPNFCVRPHGLAYRGLWATSVDTRSMSAGDSLGVRKTRCVLHEKRKGIDEQFPLQAQDKRSS